MNMELKLMLGVSRRLPAIKGMGLFGNILKRIYNRKPRAKETNSVLGFDMALEPGECVDGGLLFYPHLYDRRELDYIRSNLASGSLFIDAGANIGLYSLIASKCVGSEGKVLAIEAEPYNAEKLRSNINLNSIDNIKVIQAGLSDKHEELVMNINLNGNRGGNSLISSSENNQKGVSVSCMPLLGIIKDAGWERVDGMKIDIEGFEYRVLSSFFDSAERDLYPKFLIAEVNEGYEKFGSKDLHDLFLSHGYKLMIRNGLNAIYLFNY